MGTFHLHQLYARNRIDEWYNHDALESMEVLGIISFVVSLIAFAVNLGLAVYYHDTLDIKTYGKSNIPSAIFAVMAMRAAAVLWWSARKYKKYVLLCDPQYVFRAQSHQRIPDLDYNSINYM